MGPATATAAAAPPCRRAPACPWLRLQPSSTVGPSRQLMPSSAALSLVSLASVSLFISRSLWLPTETALRQIEPMWRPVVEDWASETQTYVFSHGSPLRFIAARWLGGPRRRR